jgi:hypothetical protein
LEISLHFGSGDIGNSCQVKKSSIKFREGLVMTHAEVQIFKPSILFFVGVLVDIRERLDHFFRALISFFKNALPAGEQMLLNVSSDPVIDIGAFRFVVREMIIINSKLIKDADVL